MLRLPGWEHATRGKGHKGLRFVTALFFFPWSQQLELSVL